MTDTTASGRQAEAELYVLLRKAGEDRHEAQALIDRLLAEAWTRGAGTVEAMNEGCSRARPCASCDAREGAADALRDIARRRVARHNIERVKHSGPDSKFCVLCLSGEHERVDDEPAATTHAVPLPGSNGISACCDRPPCEFVGERVTRDPGKVTCPGPAEAPRDALSAPHTAEPPAPGPERHPGGENGSQAGTQDRDEAPSSTLPCACCCTDPAHVGRPDHCDARLHRAFREAITRQWPGVAEFVMDDVLHDVVACHLDLVARATADLRAALAIDTQVMEKADRECDEHIAAGRAFRQLAERTQAWGEQHRDRANRYRTRVERANALLDVVALELEHWDGEKSLDLLRRELGIYRGDAVRQAGVDTTGATP